MGPKKKSRFDSGDSSEGEEEEEPKFSQAGSIKRLKFTHFMQYNEVEFNCGPNLNVIIGPNGSGKSSIVNGICLGLAGKPNVLGRSSNLTDFIQFGENSAIIEVELFHPEEENVVIVRQFDRANKSNWQINGKKAGIREVEKKVAEFRIQVDNLCQFLPQDKVHDFSRLDSKGLLNSTVDAVGDLSLKEQHAQLKELQKNMSEGEELFERKQQMLSEQMEKCRRLEEEVKAFDEKKKIEAKIKLAEEREAWSRFHEVGKVYMETKSVYERSRAKLASQEETLMPIRKEIKEAEQRKTGFERKINELNVSLRESTGRAKTYISNIEKLEHEIVQVNDQLDSLEDAEEKRKEEIGNIKNYIAEMEAEVSSTQDEGDLAPLCQEAKKKTGYAMDARDQKTRERENLKYEQRHLRQKIDERKEEMGKLGDVDRMKLSKLKQLNNDTFEAVIWLRNNPNFFQGEVQEPLVTCANIHDTRNAKYLESCINQRDMTAFFFADSNDMNRFLDIMRNEKGFKKVSAVQMPRQNLQEFVPQIPAASLKNYDFISYVKDLVSAPVNVLSFLCYNYKIHRIPVFKDSADRFYDKLVNEMGFTKIFIGNHVHSVSGSLYSSAKSTMSKEIWPNNFLDIRKDEEREAFLNTEIAQTEEKLKRVEATLKTVEAAWQQCNLDVEAARKEQREMDIRRNYKARQQALIDGKKKLLREMLAETGGTNRGKDELLAKKKSYVSQEIKSVQQLQMSIREANDIRVKIDVVRLSLQPLEEIVQKKMEELNESQDKLKDLKKDVASCEREFRIAKDTMADAMKDAHKSTGGYGSRREEPPEHKKEQWSAEEIPSKFEEIQLFVSELRARAECMDSVDPRTIREYNKTRENIQELQEDIQSRETLMANKLQNLTTLKESWVTNLTSLVSRINANFSSHFQTMGFAGEVVLKTGDHENDFDNYGIRIRVKYRDNEPLQDLTAHRQSGGERSVATALYMLALQELTTVPFRCVDEINQGMDARNERLVFELLVKTSCHVSSSQYFLLTPKLLTGLNYSPRMNLLIVYNGHSMCHYTDWNMNKFISCEE